MMKVRQNVHWKLNDKGVIEICDSWVTIRSKVNIQRGDNRSEVLVDYGPEYWSIDMTQCRKCFLNDYEPTDDPMLLCDLKNCNSAYHLKCLDENVDHLRMDPWFCPQCSEMMKHVSVDRALLCSQTKTTTSFSRPSRVASATVRQLTSKHALETSESSDNETPSSSSSSSSSSSRMSSSSSSRRVNSADSSNEAPCSSPSSTPVFKRAKIQTTQTPTLSDFTPKDVYVADDNCVLTPSPSLASAAQRGTVGLQVTCFTNVK